MNLHDETKRAVESSEERRERRVDALLRDPKIKAAVHRDQHPRHQENEQREAHARVA
jgi:hypothetical protein